jgi:tetratricopeptide (TPR) repeat protein
MSPLMKKAEAARQSWFGVSLYHRTPKQKEINRLLNHYEEALRQDDPKSQQELRLEIADKLKEIEDSSGDGHPNPAWLMETLRGNFARAMGKYDEYEHRARKSQELANETWQKAISLHNTAGACIRNMKYHEAVEFEESAIELDPGNEGFWAQLTEAYFEAGKKAAAADILSNVRRIFGLRKNSIWALCLKHDSFFRERFAHDAEYGQTCRDLVAEAVGL